MTNIHLMVITDGRQDCFERTLESARASLPQDLIRSGHIIDDSCDFRYSRWLQKNYSDFEVISSAEKSGFDGVIRLGWSNVPEKATHVFWLEDDFVFLKPVPVQEMSLVLDAHPYLVQLVLKRQPWSPEERTAGGIIEMWPKEYTEVHDEYLDAWWSEHKLFFSTNPCLIRRSLIPIGWPTGAGSERVFTDKVLHQDPSYRFAFWGKKFEPPRVMHIGENRVGVGY